MQGRRTGRHEAILLLLCFLAIPFILTDFAHKFNEITIVMKPKQRFKVVISGKSSPVCVKVKSMRSVSN